MYFCRKDNCHYKPETIYEKPTTGTCIALSTTGFYKKYKYRNLDVTKHIFI